MNLRHAQFLFLLLPPCLAQVAPLPTTAQQPRILLPLNLESVPPAKVLLDELRFYLGNDGDNNYESNTRAIKHHLLLLQEHYPEEAQAYINQMSIWTHSEHFLERLPRFFLDTLHELRWKVHPDALGVALKKLDSLLPQDPHDMIDCAAGKPMGQIIRLLAAQQAAGTESIAKRYTKSQDQDLSYAAYCALLSLQGLPEPTVEGIVRDFWGITCLKDLEKLGAEAEAMAKLIAVNEGALLGEFEAWVNAQVIADAMDYLRSWELHDYADALSCFITKDEASQKKILVTGDELHMASIEYSCLAQPSPRNIIAKRLLELAPNLPIFSEAKPLATP